MRQQLLTTTTDLPAIVQALRQAQTRIRWKPGKAYAHLNKRKNRGHLLQQAKLADYETIIKAVLQHPEAFVYVYRYEAIDYPTVVAPYEGQVWLVMFGLEGIMETAFPPDEPDTYFELDPRYIPLGKIEELMQ
jgi:hypothetical protein